MDQPEALDLILGPINPVFLFLLIKPKSVTIYYDRVVKSCLYNTKTSAKFTIFAETFKITGYFFLRSN